MTLARARRLLGHPVAVAALAVAFATVVVEGGSIPHTHLGSEPGYYNRDHDLSLLATRGGAAPLPDVAPAFFVFVVVARLAAPGAAAPESEPGRHADVRAPPVR
jgi:hypothetical protein